MLMVVALHLGAHLSQRERDTLSFLAHHYTYRDSHLSVSLFMEHNYQLGGFLRMCKPWWSLLAHCPLLIANRSQLLAQWSPYPTSSAYSPT